MGSQEPSARIAPEYPATDGQDAVRILRAGGTVLDPWQSDIFGRLFCRFTPPQLQAVRVNGRATFNNLLHGFEKLLLFVNHVDLAGSFCGGHSEVPIVIALVCMIHGSISINQSYFIHGPVTP